MSATATQTITAVNTELNFFKAFVADEKAYTYTYEHEPQRNYGEDAHPAQVHDIRGHEKDFTLDKNGFQIHPHVSAETDFTDDEKIQSEYYKEVEDILKAVTGAHKVVIFDHTIRRHKIGEPDTRTLRGPVQRVHVDQTPSAGYERVRLHTGAEAETLLRERIQIINVWRPIGGPVEESPLAVADYRSVDFEKDLVPVTLKYPHRDGETFGVRYSDKLKFYYKSRLGTDEVILIKCFESKEDGRARLTPHTAFTDPTSPEGARPRESIEVRALVFTHE
jgi:hypothetical protein